MRARLPARPALLRGLLRALALAAVPGGAVAQEAGLASPSFAVAAGAEGSLVIRVAVPEGWSLYTPRPGRTGLPLRAWWVGRSGERRVLAAAWPEGEEREEGGVTTRVYRGRVEVALGGVPEGLGPRPEVAVRWAICRSDLCVPGTTRISVP